MSYKSTNTDPSSITISTALICTLIIVIRAQPECASRAFPSRIPMGTNESLLLNLNNYFDGDNISYSVTPNNNFSHIDSPFTCQQKANQDLGRVVASTFVSGYDKQIQASLVERGAGSYVLTYLQTSTFQIVTLQLPDRQNYTNCSNFAFDLKNSSHFRLVIHCIHLKRFLTTVLISTEASINFPQPSWIVKDVPLFTSKSINSPKLTLSGQVLLRGISSLYNSYLQIWSWSDEAKELLDIVDKTYLGLDIFNLKAMQIEGNIVLLLDYHSGLHILRLLQSKKIEFIGSIQEPYYEIFNYNPVSGILYLARKGKLVSAVIKNLVHRNVAVGSSYNLFAYENVNKIITSERKLIVLGDSLINIFSMGDRVTAYRHYNIFNSQNTSNFFLLQRQNQPLTLLQVRNQQNIIRYLNCQVNSPLLHLFTPEDNHQVTVTAYSTIEGSLTVCKQSFSIQKLDSSRRDDIYDNGYQADNEVLNANLPGQGTIQLEKYGTGRNLQYKLKRDPNSKIDYIVQIRKQQQQQCAIQHRPLSPGGNIYYYKAWQNILIAQINLDYSLNYFYCNLQASISCSPKFQIPSMKPIDVSAYQLIQKTDTYSISFEALLQESSSDLSILVRKLLVNLKEAELHISVFCTIRFQNFMKEYLNITQIDIVNKRLFVLMPYAKKIAIYNLIDKECPIITEINALTFPDAYFAPRSLHFDQAFTSYRQQIMFIRQWNDLLTVRLQGRNLKPTILSHSALPEQINGTLSIALPYLLYFSIASNKTYLYQLDESHQLQYLRQLSLSGLALISSRPNKDDYFTLLDSRHVALALINPATKEKFLKIYSIDELVSVGSQYIQLTLIKQNQIPVFFKLFQSPHQPLMLLQLIQSASAGYFICKGHNIHLKPSIFFNFTSARSTLQIYTENITLTLSTTNDKISHSFQISLSNLGQGISRGSTFPSRGSSIQAASEITIDDKYWFWGTVYGYDFDCKNCKDRIKFNQKITMESQEQLQFSSRKFLLRKNDKILWAVTDSFLVEMKYNYSAWPIETSSTTNYGLKQIFPLSVGSPECSEAISVPEKSLIITLCWRQDSQANKEYQLSIISTISLKTFPIASTFFQLEGDATPKMLYKNDLIVVFSDKVALVFTIWEIQESLQLIELDQIDQEDIEDTICSIQLISNDTSPITPITKVLYGLIVTQCSSIIYYTSFSVYLEQEEIIDQTGQILTFSIPNIHVSFSQNINLPKLWSQKRTQVPSDSKIIQTIAKLQASQRDDEQILSFFTLLDRFHSYQFKMVLSKQNRIIKSINLDSIFYKFGSNIAISAQISDYLVIKYILDLGFGKLQELYGCFDLSRRVLNKNMIKQYYSFSAYVFKNFKQAAAPQEDFPWILEKNKIYHLHKNNLQVLNITSQLTARISGLNNESGDSVQTLYTQKILVIANNPISARTATITLSAVDQYNLSGGQIALIVIGSLILLIILIVVGRVVSKKIKKKLKSVPLTENIPVEDVGLQFEEEERAAQWLINKSQRGSLEP